MATDRFDIGRSRGHDFAVRDLAEQLYVFRGLTYGQIARETAVSESQLKRWGKEGQWPAKRQDYLRSKSNTLVRLMSIRESILQSLEGNPEPNVITQLLGGFRQADSLIETKLNPAGSEADRPALFLDDLRFIVETLGEIDPEGVRTISRNYDRLIAAFKERHAQTA